MGKKSINIENSTSEKGSNTNTSLEETQVITDIETTIDDTLIDTTMENETKTQAPTTNEQSVKPTQQQTTV